MNNVRLVKRFNGWTVTVDGKPVAEFRTEKEATEYRKQQYESK